MKVIYSIAAKLAGGGIGTTSYNQVRGIYRHGLLKTIFCDTAKPGHEIDTRLVKKIHASVFERLRFIPQPFQYAIKDNLFDSLVYPRLSESDIFHVWNGHGFNCLRRMKKLGALCVVERASSHIEEYERILKEEYQRWGISIEPVLPWVKRRLIEEYDRADYVATPSDFSYQSMVNHGISEDRLVKLPYGVDTDRFTPGEVGDKFDQFTVLFVGQIGFRKGVVYLLEAWKRLGLKDARLVLLGQVLDEFKKVVEKYSASLDNVEFAGFKPSLEYFQKSHLFVFPSLEEGSALVTYEALSCGLPVITTFESGSVVADGVEGYLIKIRDIDSLAERIRGLYSDRDTLRRMSLFARKKALQYTWDACGDRLVEWYKRVV